jgi:hypothetical protein
VRPQAVTPLWLKSRRQPVLVKDLPEEQRFCNSCMLSPHTATALKSTGVPLDVIDEESQPNLLTYAFLLYRCCDCVGLYC